MMWLVDFSVKAALLLGATWVAAFVLRRSSADVRHRLWVAALAGVAILSLPVAIPKPVTIAVPVQFAFTSIGGSVQSSGPGWIWPQWKAIWIAGIVVALGRLLTGVAIVAFWTRKARRVERILVSDRVATPLTWGVFRPVILFPAYAEEWPAEQRELALRHEQAHILRHDWLWQMLTNVINAVFWFHPLVWLANAELRREAEGATDDLVLASGVDASDYARQLVRVARHITGAAPVAAVPMARGKVLESRVRQILDPMRARSRASRLMHAGVVAVACACLAPLLALQAGSVLGVDPSVDRVGGSVVSLDHATSAGAPVTPVSPERVAALGVAQDRGVSRGPVAAAARASDTARTEEAVTHRMGEPGMQPPRVIFKQEPSYTEDARAAKIQGTVVLSIVIDEQGRAEDIQVTKSLDAGLDEQAMETVRRWLFTPALKDGEPVRVMASIEINFKLL